MKHTGITPTQGTDKGHDKTKVVQVQVKTRKYKGETRKSLDRNEEPRTATDLSEYKTSPLQALVPSRTSPIKSKLFAGADPLHTPGPD